MSDLEKLDRARAALAEANSKSAQAGRGYLGGPYSIEFDGFFDLAPPYVVRVGGRIVDQAATIEEAINTLEACMFRDRQSALERAAEAAGGKEQ